MASKAVNRVLNLAGPIQDLTLVTFPAASSIFTDPTEYDLSNTHQGDPAAYPQLLTATELLGAGFGLTAPVLNTYVAAFLPDRADKAVLVLNALLGLGTALAPVFVAVFVGLGFWWGLPVLSTVLLVLLLLASARLPLKAETTAADDKDAERTGIPPRLWLFAGFAVL